MICDRLKILLGELNISQRQFAMKINLDAGYFSRIMQGKVNPPDRILLLIENVFNVPSAGRLFSLLLQGLCSHPEPCESFA